MSGSRMLPVTPSSAIAGCGITFHPIIFKHVKGHSAQTPADCCPARLVV